MGFELGLEKVNAGPLASSVSGTEDSCGGMQSSVCGR